MKISKIIYLILIGVLLILFISATIISIKITIISMEKEGNFCNERGMIYESESGFYGLGNCLKIDNQRMIVESFKIKKINGEYYLQ